MLSLFLPEGLLAHFEVVSLHILGDVRTKKDCFYIYLDERNKLPEFYSPKDYESKGFYDRTIVQDFPIRGKAAYLCIKSVLAWQK
ncbi:ISAon1 family transposase N-terminal region protein [Yeosuana sp.]|uniref:ISAon1 family transposase N-terminal region protein n=1 Tax=Yeosuana sp. TaxID=2529388 RepID=UPI004054EADB